MVASGLVMLSPEKWRKSYNPQIVTHNHHHHNHQYSALKFTASTSTTTSAVCSEVRATSQGQRVKPALLLLEICDVV